MNTDEVEGGSKAERLRPKNGPRLLDVFTLRTEHF